MIADENNEDDLKERAEYILKDVLKLNLKGKRFLDYGCGMGHVAAAAMHFTPDVLGYDIERFENKIWKDNQYNFSTHLPVLISNGPYDVILAYDVLDHSDYPINDFLQIFRLLKRGGTAFIRFHPICSRHGGHLYKKFNKAYAHMVLSNSELKELGLSLPPQRVLYPVKTYEEYLKRAGFKVLGHKISSQFVEPFFEKNEIVSERIVAFYGASTGKDVLPTFQMSQSYVDFTVTK